MCHVFADEELYSWSNNFSPYVKMGDITATTPDKPIRWTGHQPALAEGDSVLIDEMWDYSGYHHVMTHSPLHEGSRYGLVTERIRRSQLHQDGSYSNPKCTTYIRCRSWFVNNQKHGMSWSYRDNGSLEMIQQYEHGKLNGLEYRYDEDGRCTRVMEWQNGMARGLMYNPFAPTRASIHKYGNTVLRLKDLGILDIIGLTEADYFSVEMAGHVLPFIDENLITT